MTISHVSFYSPLFDPEAFHLIKSIANTLLLLLLIPLLQTL